MKQMTINSVSAASLRANRKAYLSLAGGILLAVFLATAVTVCGYGILRANEEKIVQKIGYMDCVLFDQPEITDEALRQSGLFSRLGRVYALAQAEGSDVWLGYADPEGEAILGRTCVQGRLPESAGEIAVEQSALEKLRSDASVGDTVTWKLQPVNGTEEERTYTIVGILREQSGYMDSSYYFVYSDAVLGWPSAVTYPGEQFATGRTAVHRVMTMAPLAKYSQVEETWPVDYYRMAFLSRTGGKLTYWDPSYSDRVARTEQMGVLLTLGGALLLCTCIGIASAMESVLASRTEEIGMLRAVGATRRQIRRIFGRDAWLLSLATLPAGLLLGTLAAWALCALSEGSMRFSLHIGLLLPIIAVTVFCIFVSSALPLGRASRQAPMGVLRDTALLRKARRFKSKKDFKATGLIAGRQLRIHPLRQTGAALMVMATLLCTAFAGDALFDTAAEMRRSQTVAFTLHPKTNVFSTYHFSAAAPSSRLSEQDMAQLRGLEQIGGAGVYGETFVDLLLTGEPTDYLLPFSGDRFEAYDGDDSVLTYDMLYDLDRNYLDIGPNDPRPAEPAQGEAGSGAYRVYMVYEQMRAAMDAQNLPGKPVNIPLFVTDLSQVDFSGRVTEGKVDLAAIDAGEQILVYAPDIYISGVLNSSEVYMTDTSDRGDILKELKNDFFHAGDSLQLAQLVNRADRINPYPASLDSAYDIWRADYASMERHDASVSVGAVLGGEPICNQEISFITTEEGAKALGLDLTDVRRIDVSLTGDVDTETEQALQERLERIGMRGDMEVTNHLADWREEIAAMKRTLAMYVSMLLLFFAVAVAMQVGNASRRIRADRRMIGTLRAVGADEKALLGCYRLPVLITTAAGAALAILLYLGGRLLIGEAQGSHLPALIPALALMGALCGACCLLGLRGRLRRELDRSIVENIKEL